MRNPLAWNSSSFWLLVAVILPVLAVLVTWATGYLYISYGSGGFPATWRELVFQICPVGLACRLDVCTCNTGKIVQVNIDWLSLGVDILFYTAIGYSLVPGLFLGKTGQIFSATTNPPIRWAREYKVC